MQLIDWILTFLPLAAILGFAFYTRRFVQGVADYTSAGRCAGRYLMCSARAEADSGLSSAVANFQAIAVAGFVLTWWGALSAPLFLFIGIIGFVVYRYRETRVLTLPQLFEARYSKNFRIFMGMLAFLAGLLNYGIFPMVAAKFFVWFLRLDPTLAAWGMPWLNTEVFIMASYLTFTLVMMLTGGQITLMITDCIEGIFSHAVYLLIVVVLLWMVPWDKISHWLLSPPAGKSLVNPFDAFQVPDFNFAMWAMGLYYGVYITMAWQNRSGFNSAGRTPHETRMGGVLGNWRGYARTLMLTVLVMCAMTYLKHTDFAAQNGQAVAAINDVGDAKMRTQAEVPIALSHMMPAGVKGLFLLVMILGLMAADASHMHSWGSIFVQDVILPLRKKAMAPRAHIWTIRCAQIGVALFALVFSIYFPLKDYIAFWWMITGTVFQAGAGCAIIGGLYWKKGTTAGAWTGALVGAGISLVGMLANQFWTPSDLSPDQRTIAQQMIVLPESPPAISPQPTSFSLSLDQQRRIADIARDTLESARKNSKDGKVNPDQVQFNAAKAAAEKVFTREQQKLWYSNESSIRSLLSRLGFSVSYHFPISLFVFSFFTVLIAPLSYIIVSLLTCKGDFDMDRLLHRGKYKVESDTDAVVSTRRRSLISRILGFDENFTFWDKIAAGGIFWWMILWLIVTVIGTAWNCWQPLCRWLGLSESIATAVKPWGNSAWLWFWLISGIILPFVISTITLVWFGIGGFKDLRLFFHALRTMKRDHSDDGRVSQAPPPLNREAPVGAKADETAH